MISLAVALELCGFETVFDQVGMEPSGDAFNSLVKLEISDSHPRQSHDQFRGHRGVGLHRTEDSV